MIKHVANVLAVTMMLISPVSYAGKTSNTGGEFQKQVESADNKAQKNADKLLESSKGNKKTFDPQAGKTQSNTSQGVVAKVNKKIQNNNLCPVGEYFFDNECRKDDFFENLVCDGCDFDAVMGDRNMNLGQAIFIQEIMPEKEIDYYGMPTKVRDIRGVYLSANKSNLSNSPTRNGYPIIKIRTVFFGGIVKDSVGYEVPFTRFAIEVPSSSTEMVDLKNPLKIKATPDATDKERIVYSDGTTQEWPRNAATDCHIILDDNGVSLFETVYNCMYSDVLDKNTAKESIYTVNYGFTEGYKVENEYAEISFSDYAVSPNTDYIGLCDDKKCKTFTRSLQMAAEPSVDYCKEAGNALMEVEDSLKELCDPKTVTGKIKQTAITMTGKAIDMAAWAHSCLFSSSNISGFQQGDTENTHSTTSSGRLLGVSSTQSSLSISYNIYGAGRATFEVRSDTASSTGGLIGGNVSVSVSLNFLGFNEKVTIDLGESHGECLMNVGSYAENRIGKTGCHANFVNKDNEPNKLDTIPNGCSRGMEPKECPAGTDMNLAQNMLQSAESEGLKKPGTGTGEQCCCDDAGECTSKQ